MANVTEVAPDVYRISTLIPDFDLHFCQFLAKDDEPLLYHTGMKSLFPDVRAAMHGSTFIDDCARALKDLGVVMKEVFG